jgi:hypothetical protein
VLITAIDPGTRESAFVVLTAATGCIGEHGILPNEELLSLLATKAKYAIGRSVPRNPETMPHLAIEMVASYGMPVGAEVFETCVWIGRYVQVWAEWHGPHSFVYRRDVRMHLCNDGRKATDATVRQALIDRFGPGKAAAIGTKAKRGPLYGVKADVWQALAVGVTYLDRVGSAQSITGQAPADSIARPAKRAPVASHELLDGVGLGGGR